MSASFTAPTNGWTLYTVNLGGTGAATTGRFAIQYAGAADTMNYIGIDTLTVRTGDVPEPATALILASGLIGMAAARRRRRT
ncbi:PEP-CTERM sorting domain-containing protein [Massilia horti]|uniref:PEP-CTERM sorting domain-containing protein n=1 Tax=Massilia horti TaxID=2562153 RepID=A0A4Y9T3A9_9BURK|nr:PEP-CTERM sorting domain-containing protein [Massilia horti]